jgi:hypothetical protein
MVTVIYTMVGNISQWKKIDQDFGLLSATNDVTPFQEFSGITLLNQSSGN